MRFGGGRTNLAAAMEAARSVLTVERGERPGIPNLVLTFTDGGANIRPAETIPRATGRSVTYICTSSFLRLIHYPSVHIAELNCNE